VKTQDLQKDKQYIHITRMYSKLIIRIRYTGTTREVNDLMYWFFTTEDGSTIFLTESEVGWLTEL
jgi:hypothetical protein